MALCALVARPFCTRLPPRAPRLGFTNGFLMCFMFRLLLYVLVPQVPPPKRSAALRATLTIRLSAPGPPSKTVCCAPCKFSVTVARPGTAEGASCASAGALRPVPPGASPHPECCCSPARAASPASSAAGGSPPAPRVPPPRPPLRPSAPPPGAPPAASTPARAGSRPTRRKGRAGRTQMRARTKGAEEAGRRGAPSRTRLGRCN